MAFTTAFQGGAFQGSAFQIRGNALSVAEIAALAQDAVRIGIFFRLEVDPVQRLWLGVGDCKVRSNAYDATGAVYQGLGELHDVPEVQQLINGVAERVTFTVSGVSPNVMELAGAEADEVKGAAVALGVVLFDGAWQQLGPPRWLWRGTADVPALEQQPTDDGGAVRTIELSVGSLFTGRRRRGLSYLTDYDQQQRHPGDKFCERTILYAQEVEKVWPRFS